MASTKFEEKHKKKILLFRAAGLWLIRRKGTEYVLENGSYIFSRIIWMLWHIIGIAAGMWIKEIVSPKEKDKFETNGTRPEHAPWLDISMLLVVFFIAGPAQLRILWRNQKWLPKILPAIKKLEDFGEKEFGNEEQIYATHQNDHAETGSIHSSNASLNELEEDCCRNCCSKFNKLVSKLSFTVCSIGCIVLFSIAAYTESNWTDTKDEWKLVVMMFYLIFPILTTWLCILLIEHHTEMYKPITNMKIVNFKDPQIIRKVSDYMTQMFRIFENMDDHIFQLTLGINFAIFVTVGVVSMFEILQGLLERKVLHTSFSDILYGIPLSLSIWHIYKLAHAADHLYHHVHRGLFMKLKKLLPDLLMPREANAPKSYGDQFKNVEMVYKNLKDWPPKVTVSGGYQVNYKILTGMIFFIFAYARVFLKISGGQKGIEEETTSTTLPPGM